jgi:hypothetical protein
LAGAPASPGLANALAGDALALTRESGHLAVLRSDSLCAAVFDGRDRLIHATPGWAAAGVAPAFDQLRAVPSPNFQ